MTLLFFNYSRLLAIRHLTNQLLEPGTRYVARDKKQRCFSNITKNREINFLLFQFSSKKKTQKQTRDGRTT
jgi:hypothetical protein